MNLFQSLMSAATKPEKPLHVGEVMTLWAALAALQEGRVLLQGLLNHTADPELSNFLKQYLADLDQPWRKRYAEFMKEHGIPLPPIAPEKPRAEESAIPPGAKFTDSEIANAVAAKLLGGIQILQVGILQCLRYDVGNLLLSLQVEALKQAVTLRNLMEERGWLKIPPYWYPTKPD